MKEGLKAILEFLTNPNARESLTKLYQILEQSEETLDKIKMGLEDALKAVDNFRAGVSSAKKVVAGAFAFTQDSNLSPLLNLLKGFVQ